MTARRAALRAGLVVLLLVATVGCVPQPRCPGCPPLTAAQRTAVFSGLGAWWDVFDWSPS